MTALKLFTESLTGRPVIGWKTANHRLPFSIFTKPLKGQFLRAPFLFCLSDSSELTRAYLFSQSSKHQDTCEDFIQHLQHRNQGSISSIQPKRNINTLKGRFFQISFPQNDCLQGLFFSFISFPVNASFYKIFICVVFLSSCRHHNIL